MNTRAESESRTLVDPIKYNNLTLFQKSIPTDSQLLVDLNELYTGHLSLLDETRDWLTELQQTKPNTLIIDMVNIPFKAQDDLLNDLSKLKHIHSLYIRGSLPKNEDDRTYLFTKYPFIKALLENEQSLIAQWAMDTVNEYKQLGDLYVKQGNKDKAQECFDEGVALNKRLSAFLDKKKTLHK